MVDKLFELGAYVVSVGVKKRTANPNINYVQCDLSDKSNLLKSRLSRKFEYIFNLSGYINHCSFFQDGSSVLANHFSSLLNILDYIDKSALRCFIQLGSSDEYGISIPPQNETYKKKPFSTYSYAKSISTDLLQMLSKIENFPSVIVRPFLVYGPYQSKNRLIPHVIQGCLNDSEFAVSSGEQLRDFCYIDDFIEGVLKVALLNNPQAEVFNIASGNPVSVKFVIKTINEIIGKGNPIWNSISDNNMNDLYADITKMNKTFNWYPQTTLTSGLIKTINFYKKNCINEV